MCAYARRPPLWAMELTEQMTQIHKEIQKGIHQIMALVQIEQTDLDTLAANLEAVKTSLEAEIASLQVSLPAADLSGLNAALTDLQSLEPPAST